MSCEIVFVCQGGALEYKAAVLATSLVENLVGSSRQEICLIAAVPADADYQAPRTEILAYLESLNVAICSIANPISTDYGIANKIACMTRAADCRFTVFLDSDMLCLGPYDPFEVSCPNGMSGKLEDWHHHDVREWQLVYRHFDMPTPGFSYRSTVFNEPMPLYFNTGHLVVDNSTRLGEYWLAAARQLDALDDLPRRRPNLDQLALPVAVMMAGIDFGLLGEAFNYPAELRSVNPAIPPILCHYHDLHMILCDPLLCRYVSSLCDQHSKLQEILEAAPDRLWQLILKVGRGQYG